MDRRSTLATLLGQSRTDHSTSPPAPALITSGLNPYNGPFDYEQAAHLLRAIALGGQRHHAGRRLVVRMLGGMTGDDGQLETPAARDAQRPAHLGNRDAAEDQLLEPVGGDPDDLPDMFGRPRFERRSEQAESFAVSLKLGDVAIRDRRASYASL